jgi:GT2 family glycosyltransferase
VKRADRLFADTILKSAFEKIETEALLGFLQNSGTIDFKATRSPLVSVIIVTFNRPEIVLKCLRALAAISEVKFETIIFDNASSESTRDLLAKVRGARVIYNEKNLHFLRAANAASKFARGKHLLFLNSDCFVYPDAIGNCVDLLLRDPKIGAVGPKILNLNGSVQEAGSIIWNDGTTLPYAFGASPFLPEVNFVRETDYVSGAFLMTPKKVFRKLGGFDERFKPAYYEDTDYCVRLHKAGLKVVYNPSSLAVHLLHASAQSSDEVRKLMQKNRTRFKKTHAKWLRGKFERSDGNLCRARHTKTPDKRVLVIAREVSEVRSRGKRTRVRSLANRMAKKGFDVTLFATRPVLPLRAAHWGIDSRVEIIGHCQERNLDELLKSRPDYYDLIVFEPDFEKTLVGR